MQTKWKVFIAHLLPISLIAITVEFASPPTPPNSAMLVNVIKFSNKTGQKKEEEENEGMKSPGN
ncbi:hypothetical protein BLOT_008301 [Blomia tropicalis]|nr:hypothetical protein BLOT_008301 [Blomia tropicalis]